MRRLLPLLLLAGCPAPDGDDADDVTPTDTDGVDANDPAETDEPVSDERWVYSEPVSCPDITRRAGEGWYSVITLREDAQGSEWLYGHGVAVADLDGDGREELFFPGERESRLYTWTGVRLRDVSHRLPDVDLTRAAGAVFADLEGDGDLDLFVARFGRPDVLLRNDGLGGLEDVTELAGVAGPAERRSAGASFGDLDGDGDLDLFVAAYGPLDLFGDVAPTWDPGDPNGLYENRGDGTFVDRSDVLPGSASTGYGFAGGIVDLDGDGRQELYVVNDFGSAHGPNRVVRVDAGWQATPRSEMGLDVDAHGMGLGLGDLNEDGQLDVVVSDWNEMHAYLSSGGLWFDATQLLGLQPDLERSRVAWSPLIADLDNDGLLDLFTAYGEVDVEDKWRTFVSQDDLLWRQDPKGVFTEVGRQHGLAQPEPHRGGALADLNDDGFLDLIRPAVQGPDLVHLSRCDHHAWLRVRLVDEGPNPFAIGARVRLTDGDRRWTDQLVAGAEGFGSSGPPELHFGLGDRDTVEKMEIQWPDGTREMREDIPLRRVLTVHRRAPSPP